jgi:phenylacetate-CoA ligase
VVGTSLHNFSMPLIRYEVGDLVELQDPDPPCKCGRSLPRILRILGREGDAVVTPEGRLVTALFIVFDEVPGVAQGQVIQEAVDRIRVRVIRESGFSDRSEQDLLRYLRQFVGPAMKVKFEYPSHDSFQSEAGPGKLRTVISRLPNPASDFLA